MNLPDDFVQQIFDELQDLRMKFAAARANSRASEENRKIVKSQLRRAFQGSSAAADDFAHVHPRYKEAVDGMCKAGEMADNAEWELKIKEMAFQAWRTIAANERIARS